MPKPLSILTTLVAVSACAALVCAQEVVPVETLAAANPPGEKKPAETVSADPATAVKPGATPAPLVSPESSPEPTPKPKRRSFFSWLFGTRKPKATPVPAAETPAPVATPTPRKGGRRLAATPTPKPTPTPKGGEKAPAHTPTPKPEKPAATPKPEKAASATPVPAPVVPPTATPPVKKTSKGKATPAPSVSSNVPPPEAPGADADEEAKEKYRFEVAKSKALQDPQVLSLKAKADEATTDEESRAALRAYNKALFARIRKIDSGVSEWADRLEAAILKRLNE